MPISETFVNQFKCCLSDDGHIFIDPVVLKCKGNSCRKCISDSKKEDIYCYKCNNNHLKKELLDAPGNELATEFVKMKLSDLFEYVGNKWKLFSEKVQSTSNFSST